MSENKDDKFLINKIDQLMNEVEFLKNEFEDYKNETDEILDSYHEYFNIIIANHKLIPMGVSKQLQELCCLLLDFVSNICYKYNLEYWLLGGTLLGAVRHNGFIPWDDELDIGMCRKDFNKFFELVKYEIDIHGLSDVIDVRLNRKANDFWIMGYMQLSIFPKYNLYLTHIDIFPHDFVEEFSDDTMEVYNEQIIDFHKKLIKGVPRKVLEKEYFEKVNVSYDYQKYLIPGIESRRNKFENMNFFRVLSDDFFPLINLEFCGKYYSCPKCYDFILKDSWPDYYMIPKVIKNHGMIKRLEKIEGIGKHYQKYINLFKTVNEKFIARIGTDASSYVTIPFGFTASKFTKHSVLLKGENCSFAIYEFGNKSIDSLFKEYRNNHKNDNVTENIRDIHGIGVRCLNLEVNGEFVHTNYYFNKNGITYQVYPKGDYNQNTFEQLFNSINKLL